jgi:DNA-binding PadR family transcriptional regulator
MPEKRLKQLTVSAKELLILDLLVGAGELYGLQLVAATTGRLKRGTVYVTLGRMQDKGFVTATVDDAPPGAGGLPRPRYAPTALGRRVMKAWSAGATLVLPEFAR